jgi:methionine sulfoxide reductase catalytic subunit
VLIRSPDPTDPKPSEICAESIYLSRRELIAALPLASTALFAANAHARNSSPTLRTGLQRDRSNAETLTSWQDATQYNNYYEFGTGKSDPARNAQEFQPLPWRVKVMGECNRPGELDIDQLLRTTALQERIYRHRCVEAWSMVLPWVGLPLAQVLMAFEPNSRAKYVAFSTLFDKQRMPGQRYASIDWPYEEALRIDEAMHPLSLLAVGLYGRMLPNQNGAPLRLVVPWKYGFKGIKAIVRIEFTEYQPQTSWNRQQSLEYGFYANVNPSKDHPRWSQASEQRIAGSSRSLLQARRIKTQMFNGYGAHVASLYQGMDLQREY